MMGASGVTASTVRRTMGSIFISPALPALVASVLWIQHRAGAISMQATTSTAAPTPFTLEPLFAWVRRQRGAGWIHHDEPQRLWQVFGYVDAERVLSDPSAFSSDFSEIMPHQRDFDLFARGNFVRMDPPKHRKLRSLVS